MKTSIYISLLMMLFISLLPSCKEEQTPLVLLVYPIEIVSEVSAGDYVYFGIKAFSDEEILKVSLNQKDNQHGLLQVFDTLLNNSDVEFDIPYKVPYYEDSSELTIEIVAISKSFENKEIRQLIVLNDDEILTEFSGNIIFSGLSGKMDAYNLKRSQPVFSNLEPDSLVDIMDNSVDSLHGTSLSFQWKSPAGLKFSRFNDFNYAKATRRSVIDSYKAASSYNQVSNIRDNDIIFVGNVEALGVILVTQVIDTDSTLNDRYIFNVKMIN